MRGRDVSLGKTGTVGAALGSETGPAVTAGPLGPPRRVGARPWVGGGIQRWRRGPILGLPILAPPLPPPPVLPMAHPKVTGQVTTLFSINREWRWGGANTMIYRPRATDLGAGPGLLKGSFS